MRRGHLPCKLSAAIAELLQGAGISSNRKTDIQCEDSCQNLSPKISLAANCNCQGCGEAVSEIRGFYRKSWHTLSIQDLLSVTPSQRKSKYCKSCIQDIKQGRLPCQLQPRTTIPPSQTSIENVSETTSLGSSL